MTIKDIARESGYSVGTVSRVLNNHSHVSKKAYKTIMEVVERNHFRVNNNARHLKLQNASPIAVIVKGAKNMLFASILEILQELISSTGFVCLIFYIDELDNEVEKAIQITKERQVKGILFLGSHIDFFKQSFSYVKVPCVMVTNSARKLNFSNLSSVCVNDRTAAAYAVNHLIELGHKEIRVLGGNIEYSYPSLERYLGCIDAFEQANIDFNPDIDYSSSHFSMSEGYASMKCILKKRPDTTAVFALADVLAIGAMRAITETGLRIPEDISLMGYDGIDLGNYLTPKLSTVRQPYYDIAKRSFTLLKEMMRGGGARHIQSPFYLATNESIAKYNNTRR